MTASPDVVIVGAGVIGCATAYYLAAQGAKVLVVDKEAVGAGASFHATGLFTPWSGARSEAELALFDTSLSMSLELVPRLREETGVDTLFQLGEGLRVALRPEQVESGKAIAGRPGLAGVKLAFLDGDEARRMEPRLSPQVLGALWSDRFGQVDSYRYTLALACGAELKGAEFATRHVTGLARSGSRVAGVETTTGPVSASVVVLAMGAWSAEAASWLGHPVPVTPLKGQNMRLRWQGEPFRYLMGQVGWGHLIQRADGFLSAGSTEEPGQGLSTRTTAQARQQLMAHALSIMPCLEEAEIVQEFAGPRPLSADNLPLMGPAPGLEGVYLNTGHGHSGVFLAAASGRHMADLVLQGPSTVAATQAFLPQRFVEGERS